MESVVATLAATQLRRTGHVARMDASSIRKQIVYVEIAQGARKVGGQEIRFKDVSKRHIKSMGQEVDFWEHQASDKSGWHGLRHEGKQWINQKNDNCMRTITPSED